MQTNDFFTVIRERRSVRHYNPDHTISRQELEEILSQAILAPSSSNLQPWRFLVIDDPALKEKLLPIAWNQQQVVQASAVIAVLGDVEAYKNAENIYQRAVAAGYMSEEVKQTLVNNISQTYGNAGLDMLKKIAYIDGGLVSMQLMLVAKAKGYDTVPMGGYDAEKFKAAFEVPENYVPIMLIALGKAAQPGHPTVRLSVEEVAYWNQFSK
jgi:nitroreductase